MAEDPSKLPLVVSSGSGSGGVSPRVTMMDDVLVQNQTAPAVTAQSFPTAAAMTTALVPLAQIQVTAAAVGKVIGETQVSTQAYGSKLLEAARISAQKANHFIEDMASVKTPAEAFALQAAYWQDQRSAVLQQTAEFQNAFMQFLASLTPKQKR